MDTGFRTPLLYGCRRVLVSWTGPNGESQVSSGTGFVVEYEGSPVLVTNRHVVDPNYFGGRFTGWSYSQVSSIGTSVDRRSATTHYVAIDGPRVAFASKSADVAVVDLTSGTAAGDMLPGGSLVPIVNYFGVEWLRDNAYFDGEELSTGDPVFMVGHPNIGGEQSQLPLLVDGIVSSDPRLEYRIPRGRLPQDELEDVLLLHSSSYAGMSGGPIFVPWRDRKRAPAIVGINAGRVLDSVGGADIFTYAYKSNIIVETLGQLGAK